MRTLFLVLFCSVGVLRAQQGEPEIRRAIPVQRPSPTPAPGAPAFDTDVYENPSWMERVPKAVPVASPPEEAPAFRPSRTPQGRIEVAPPPPAPAEALRSVPEPGPANSAQADLDVANSLYERKMYEYAIVEYEKFLISHPEAPGRDRAFFRIGECHRLLGNDAVARESYARLLRDFQKGEFAGSAAYRLGEFLYAEEKFDQALLHFQLAVAEAASDEVRLSARYNVARSLDRLGRREEAAAAYAQVAAVKNPNPFRDYALLSLANTAAANGKKDDALKSYEQILEGSGPAAVRAEAAVKAASLAAELGDKKKAARLFEFAARLPDAGEWKTVALIGSVRANFDLGEFRKVAALSEKPLDDLPEEARPEVLLLAANSYRQLGNTRAARAVYDRLLLQYPDSKPAGDARFRRLISLYQLNDPGLPAEIDKFLKDSTDPQDRAQVTLLKAETLFKEKKYAEARPLYAEIQSSPLDAEMKTKALYKLGWCQAQSGQPAEAVATFSSYLEQNPDAPNAASARLQRGLALQQNKDYTAALKDFDALIETNKGPEREVALQQKALILGQQQDYAGMTALFQKLLDEYPKTTGAAQANFWIGWANFEKKDYPAAIKNLEIANQLDPAQYGQRAALRIILSHYYLQDRAALQKALAAHKDLTIPVEITRWLGRKSFEEGDYEGAEQGLSAVVSGGQAVDPEILIELAEAQIRLGKSRQAADHVAKFLETAHEPRSRARGLLASSAVSLAGRNFAEASKLAEEAILLQPEGRLNAEGRLLTGEICFASGDYPGAARAFMSVALLYDDPAITPRALQRASDAYRKVGNLMESEKALQDLQKRFPDSTKSAKTSRRPS